MHWAAKYVGMPYEPAARGPDKVDCWGLVHLVYQREFNIDLPLYPGVCQENPVECNNTIKQGLAAEWTRVLDPFDGALVAMSQSEVIHHVGLYVGVEKGRVLHCWKVQRTVVADTHSSLKLRGIKVIQYYRHQLWPTSSKP